MASILQFIWPLPDKGLRKRLYRVTAPTLLVWGAEDRLVHPAYGDDFVAAIADARLEIVDGAGHLPQLEQPDAHDRAGHRLPRLTAQVGRTIRVIARRAVPRGDADHAGVGRSQWYAQAAVAGRSS